MHRIVRERLEYLLPGDLESGKFQDVAAHLQACDECRREVSGMRHYSRLVQTLRAPAEIEPAPGFYGRLLDGIASQLRPSPWSVFFDPHFARRLVYAALTALLVMGSYFISTERNVGSTNPEPEAIMATAADQTAEDLPSTDSDQQRASDRDRILVQLATYSQ